jgi:predicted esterase
MINFMSSFTSIVYIVLLFSISALFVTQYSVYSRKTKSGQEATMASFGTTPGLVGAAGRTFGPIISYPALSTHTATVIMLHGLGDTGNGWAPVAPELNLAHVRWVFPTAPTRSITVNMGMSMPGWFDIDHLDEASFLKMMKGHHGFDPEGTSESVEYVGSLIEKEIQAGIPPERIVVGGFSQGGHVALKSLVHKKLNVAGLMALSTWLEPQHVELSHNVRKTPIFYGHGASDPLIPPMVAQLSVDTMQKQGFGDLEFKMYPGMQHSTCYEEMRDMKAFLEKVIPDKKLTVEDIDSMSVRELKDFISSRGDDPSKSLEKSELRQQAKSHL